jgi:hypothetical protein
VLQIEDFKIDLSPEKKSKKAGKGIKEKKNKKQE